MSNTFLKTTGHWSKAWNAKRSNLIVRELRNMRYEVEAEYARLIALGYSIFDIPAEGGLTYLSAKTPGSYLCLWKICEPAYLDTPETGTTAAGTNNTTHITLDSGASSVDDYYVGMVVQFTGGTGSGQYNIITDYDGSTKVATVTKAWTTAPVAGSTIYKIGGYDYVVADSDVAIHDDVRILGIKIDSSTYKIEAIDRTLKFLCEYSTVAHRTFDDKLSLSFVKAYFGTNGSANYAHYYISFNNCELHLMNYIEISDMAVFDSNVVYCDAAASNALYGYYRDTTISNCKILINNSISIGEKVGFLGNSVIVRNCEIIGSKSGTLVQFGNVSGLDCVVDNIYCESIDIAHFSTSVGVIYFKDCTVSYAFSGVILRSAYPDRQNFISPDSSAYALNTAEIINDENFKNLDVIISSSLNNVRVAGNEYSRRYYEFSFHDSNIVGSEFKTMFAREQSLLVVWRDDLDDTFVNDESGALKIKNLALFEHDGETPYDYRNNENFFLLAEDSDGAECVFCWYQGIVYPSAFSDYWDDYEYTITRCFQILEAPEKMTWRNKINGIDDSPVEGSGSWKDCTSVYVGDFW